MKSKTFLIKLLIITVFFTLNDTDLLAQPSGIVFEPVSESWGLILRKARSEHKYIFLDCYATWCVPCKTMDELVYPDKQVGDFLNEHFISVRLQMDKTPADNENIKNWYDKAEEIARDYAVNAFPTFLFFSPDGKPLHKVVGGRFPAKNFLASVKNALNPAKQYYALLGNYQPGKLNLAETKGLAFAIAYNDTLAGKIAFDYLRRIPKRTLFERDKIRFMQQFSANKEVNNLIAQLISNYRKADFTSDSHQDLLYAMRDKPYAIAAVKKYFSSLSSKQLSLKANLNLLSFFPELISLHDRYFKMLYTDFGRINTLMKDDQFSTAITDKVIDRIIIQPKLAHYDSIQRDPDWTQLKCLVRMQTDSVTSERTVYDARYYFYKEELKKAESTRDESRFYWGQKLSTVLSHHIKDTLVNSFPDGKDNPGVRMYLNNNAWTIFTYSNCPEELTKALFWADKVVAMTRGKNSNALDTKANLLYKLGRKQEAIALEGKAKELNPKASDITRAWELMQNDKPTWPVQQ